MAQPITELGEMVRMAETETRRLVLDHPGQNPVTGPGNDLITFGTRRTQVMTEFYPCTFRTNIMHRIDAVEGRLGPFLQTVPLPALLWVGPDRSHCRTITKSLRISIHTFVITHLKPSVCQNQKISGRL